MFRAKDTICITMQISIIKCWQFIFPGKERKMFSVPHSFCFYPAPVAAAADVDKADLMFKLNGLSWFHKWNVSSFMIFMYSHITGKQYDKYHYVKVMELGRTAH